MKLLKLLIAAAVLLHGFAAAQIAVKGETVYTMNGTPIANGVVLIKNGKIEKVGAEKDVKIPADYQVLSGKIVTPGLIDAHSVVGLAGMYITSVTIRISWIKPTPSSRNSAHWMHTTPATN